MCVCVCVKTMVRALGGVSKSSQIYIWSFSPIVTNHRTYPALLWRRSSRTGPEPLPKWAAIRIISPVRRSKHGRMKTFSYVSSEPPSPSDVKEKGVVTNVYIHPGDVIKYWRLCCGCEVCGERGNRLKSWVRCLHHGGC